jgi:uncharacterized protein YndB with AHSA1/START domain
MTARTDPRRIADDELLITREFDAPLALVWRLWEDVEQARRWYGPEGFAVLDLDIDFRPGGAWRCHMHSDAYGHSWSSGHYREIERHRRIVHTFAWEQGSGETTETLVTVTFEQRDGRTIQHFHQTSFSSVDYRDGHVAGWNSQFNKEQAYVEGLAKGEKS